MDSLTTSNNQFALEFSKKLAESAGDKNIFFSPWSISTALAMVYLGAKGNTATQMEQVLQLKATGTEITSSRFEKKRKTELSPRKAEDIHSDFQALISEINKASDSYLLKTANRLYGEKTYPFHCEYLENMKKYFGAEPQSVNFLETADQTRAEINSWVENQTEGKIVKLLPDDSIDSMTRLVLVNAVYFKGKWKEEFKPKDTIEKPFRVNKTTTKPVKMMSMKRNLEIFHVEKPKAKGIQLYYGNGDVSMFIVLPDDINGLKELEKTITYGKLSDWTHEDMMEKYDVQLYLPRFKLEESYDLKSTLSSMGMSDAFSTNHADFSGITERKNLFLSEVFHKSFVEVNEEGTEASASTADEISFRMNLPSITVNVDHPFLFFIKHKKTNNILFYGRVYSP
ncbi:serpin B10 isoform X1 [Dromiciops gliroides]|uniref:serpin B10 isoform X1 n=1 Tax=Dromiciops gliroides TaxID=33562 RepID=UPI001CC81C0B|nr:serpin B10 isoform X1 [Dromiciops gliroides]XP_043835258.1 serpin B10 isoform X1 [Dromiciops gliroides]